MPNYMRCSLRSALLIGLVSVGGGYAADATTPKPTVAIQITLPNIETSQYYRPYVAVWVENEQEDVVKTLSVWSKQPDWLKDMRRWWRKTGRYEDNLDAVSGATRRPGQYQVIWDGTDQAGQLLPNGRYFINVEAAREHGSRSWVRDRIELGTTAQYTVIAPTEELGEIIISTVSN